VRVAVVLLLGLGCAVKQPAGAGAEYFPARAWRTSTPEEQGIDSTQLLRMLEDIQTNGVGIDGIVIVRHGHLVFESYLAPYDADTVHNLKSSSKSVLSALVGIALREQVLDGVDQKVSAIFPEYFTSVDDPRRKDITLRHLLTMSAGIEWKEISPQAERLWASDDWVGGAIRLPLVDAPGETFTYSTALTHLASAAIARRSGTSTRAFAERYLFEPVGIRAGLWRRDPQGIHWGGADLFLTPRDMARFGYLYLKHGAWNGRQVVPSEWVGESTRAQVRTGGWGGIDDYGYWWWIDPTAYIAVGLGGQVIAVVPEQDLVVVFTGAVPEGVPFALFRKYIAPAIRPARLPPNPAAERAVAALERQLEKPAPLANPFIPEAAGQIAARSFRLEPNRFGFTGLRLECASARSCSLVLESPGQKTALLIGLDGRYRIASPAGFGDVPVACRGSWVDPGSASPTFALSLVQVGDPVHTEARLTFEGTRVSVSVIRKTFEVQALSLAGAE
jgi:CubicO group peptidase (beta-lactamase class C family)